MICPNDKTQMHQLDKIGGGESTDMKYETWEVKQCPICLRTVKEYYCAELISKNQVAKLKEETATIMIDEEEDVCV